MYDMGLDRPNLRLCYTVLCLHNVYAMSLDLRLSHTQDVN
jgi:hypothetical protein